MVFLAGRLALLIAVLCMLGACSNMLFYPIKPHLLDPRERGVEYQDIYIQTAGHQQLHGWFLPQTGELKGTVLFFHGNGENISTHVGAVYWLPDQGYRVVIIDYRGYGKSDGVATLDGAIADIQSSITYTVDNYLSDKPLVVLGQSIGASMSIYAVATSELKDRIDGLVLIAPFSDYQRIARETLAKSWLTWLFQYPLSWTISNEYRPLEYIQAVNPVPVYFIHGSLDKLISTDHSQKLFEEALFPKALVLLEAGHNDLAAKEEYKMALLEFLGDVAARKR